VIREFSPTIIFRDEASTVSESRRRTYLLLSIVGLALVLRLYGLSLYPLEGDEYGSLAEAKSVGLNWNSIIYSGLMHYWIRLGSTELWLRLPSAIFGTATSAILFKIGAKLGGWRTGVVAALLAATSPFNLFHSQEVRFYSLFIFASAAFMLAMISYLESRRTRGRRATVLLTGAVLVFSHFLGVLAVYAQAAATAFAAKTGRSRRKLSLILFGLPFVGCGLLLTPFVRHGLWRIYQIYGNAPSSLEPVMTPISIVNLAKAAYAGFVFIFGYHVYPLRLVLVIPGICLTVVLLIAGARTLWRRTQWGFLPFAYLFVLLGIYLVLDAVGGRVAGGVSPRHVSFVWPVFVLLTAIGVTSFKRPVLYVLMAAALTVNGASIWSGLQKDWTYGAATDYRSAAEYASRSIGKDTALIHDGRSQDEINFYFPSSVPLIDVSPFMKGNDVSELHRYQRLVFVTDDWEAERRRGFDRLMDRLSERYSVVDGRVDYPLFEYVLERKPSSGSGYELCAETKQVLQPLSIYGLEFQDLSLPVSVRVKDVPLNVIGAFGLPDLEGKSELSIPLAHSVTTNRVVLLTNIIGVNELRPDQPIAEIVIENKRGETMTFPLRLGNETTSWDKRCEPAASCATVFEWRKRMAIVGQNRYEGSLRDFAAGLHGVAFDLSGQKEVVKLTVRYVANSGQLYVWGIALPSN